MILEMKTDINEKRESLVICKDLDINCQQFMKLIKK